MGHYKPTSIVVMVVYHGRTMQSLVMNNKIGLVILQKMFCCRHTVTLTATPSSMGSHGRQQP